MDADSHEPPGQSQTYEDVEDVRTDGVRDGHVPLTLTRYHDAGHGVWDAGARSQKGNPHDTIRYTDGVPNQCHLK